MPSEDDPGLNSSSAPHLRDIAARRLSRRATLGGLTLAGLGWTSARAQPASSLTFTQVPPGLKPGHAVAPGYKAEVLIRWGDPVLSNAPAFDPRAQTAAAQARQFGTNNDFLAYLPLPRGGDASDRGLLWVNHEYTQPHMMFPRLTAKDSQAQATKSMVEVELAALGGSVIELRRENGTWQVVANSRYARRVTLASTSMALSGPAAGHARLRTRADPSGTRVIGTYANCGGGVTPWGTILSGEENFQFAFAGEPNAPEEARNFQRTGIGKGPRAAFGRFHDRFNLEKEPREANRFGWVVEIDPYDPGSTPVKRTALGRFKHEAATVWVNPNGTITVYSGDDEANEYLYKFVSTRRYDQANRAANFGLLDQGTLYVARFSDDGTVRWLPLVFGQGPLTAANGFASQADVLIETRRAADLLEATPMDRPEDVETNPLTGRAYVVLTSNKSRKPDALNQANPRANNGYGHILELIPPNVDQMGEDKDADHSALEHRWDMFLLGGPRNTERAFLACPDNIAFDNTGRIWIATDQGGDQAKFGVGDGLWAADTEGPARAAPRFFYRVPVGAELCGPCFTPDNRTLFVAVQHPGADAAGATFDTPPTRWPDFQPDTPPRPAVVVITREDGGIIGT